MIIGLTGGIGSGKSVVAKLFETMDCAIYNSDDKAKEVYFIKDVKEKVIALLGEHAYLSPKELNKKYISDVIFTNKTLLQNLNAIIHPAVKNDFIQFSLQYADKLIVKESAILFETGIYKEMDITILVTAPLEERIERVIKRNSITREEVEKRIAAQWSDEKKMALSNYIISNARHKALIPQALHIITKLRANA